MSNAELETPEALGIDIARIEHYLILHDELADAEAEVKRIKAEIEVEEKLIVEQFALSGIKSLNKNGKLIGTHTSRYASAKKEFRTELVAWAKANGLDDMIVLQPQSFASWCREQLECDEEDGDGEAIGLPEEIAPMVSVYEKVGLRVRKA